MAGHFYAKHGEQQHTETDAFKGRGENQKPLQKRGARHLLMLASRFPSSPSQGWWSSWACVALHVCLFMNACVWGGREEGGWLHANMCNVHWPHLPPICYWNKNDGRAAKPPFWLSPVFLLYCRILLTRSLKVFVRKPICWVIWTQPTPAWTVCGL